MTQNLDYLEENFEQLPYTERLQDIDYYDELDDWGYTI